MFKTKDDQRLHYFPGYRAAQQLGISSHLLSRITGTVFILRGPREADLEHASRVNIGLNLKVNETSGPSFFQCTRHIEILVYT